MSAQEYDVVIIGGGPAALSAAVYSGRAELKTLILERAMVGGQAALSHEIDNYPGFPEGIDGPTLCQQMQQQATRFGAELRTEEATTIEVDGLTKIVRTSAGEYRTPVVLLATGADPRKLGVPGEEELRGRGVSYCATCDGPFFRDKDVVVVGGGDAALKEALFLTKFVSQATIVHRRQEFRAEKIYQTQVRQSEKTVLQLDCVVERIFGEGKVAGVTVRNVKTDATQDLSCDGVFIFIGHEPNTQFLSSLLPLDPGGHIETGWDMMTSVPGVFAIGDVRKGSYRQIATAVGEGATAAIAAEHWITTPQKR